MDVTEQESRRRLRPRVLETVLIEAVSTDWE